MNTATRLNRGENIVGETVAEVVPATTVVIKTFEHIGYHAAMFYRGHLVKSLSAWTEGGRENATSDAKGHVRRLGITENDAEPMLVIVLKAVIRYERRQSYNQPHPYEREPNGEPKMVETYERPTNRRLHSHAIVWASKPGATALHDDTANYLVRGDL